MFCVFSRVVLVSSTNQVWERVAILDPCFDFVYKVETTMRVLCKSPVNNLFANLIIKSLL